MSSDKYFEEAFKSSRETVAVAADEIGKKLSNFKADESEKRTHFCFGIIGSICRAIAKTNNDCSFYCDILHRLLLPNIDAASAASGSDWSYFLDCIKYFHCQYYTKKLFEDANKIFTWMTEKFPIDVFLKTPEKDFRKLLTICWTHLLSCYSRKIDSKSAYANITALVNECHRQKQSFSLSLLIEVFRENLFSNEKYMIFINTPGERTHRSQMLDAFFSALTKAKPTNISDNNTIALIYIDIQKLLRFFIQFDIADQAKTVDATAFNFLRACKDLEIWKEHKYFGYTLCLIYYYMKLLYKPDVDKFQETLVEILEKFASHMDKLVPYLGKSWAVETIVTCTRVFGAASSLVDGEMLHQRYWQQINDKGYVTKSRLLERIIDLAPGISYDSGELWTCCNSVRKHITLVVCQQELDLYIQYIQQCVKSECSVEQELSDELYSIVKHSVNVIESMNCPLAPKTAMHLVLNIANVAQKSKTKKQAKCCIILIECLPKLRSKVLEHAWKKLLKCMISAAQKTEDFLREAETYAINIALLLGSSTAYDMACLRQNISLYYKMKKSPEVSVVEFLDHCQSPLKVNGYNRRLLHSIESDVVIKNKTGNILVFTSLLKCCDPGLDFVLLARNIPDIDVSSKLERLYAQLKKKHNLLSPIEYLTLGHLCKRFFTEQLEKMKDPFPGFKFHDEELQKMLDNEAETLSRIDVVSEMSVMRIGMEAVEGFRKFYEASGKVQETCIEWEPIVDDLSVVARWFQFRGYVDSAYQAWLLLYRIAGTIDDILNQIRALQFIFQESEFVQSFDPQFDFNAEIKVQSPRILNCLLDLKTLTPRRQNYVLVCICNLAFYYTKTEKYSLAQILLDLIDRKLEELPERRGQYELVRATHDAIIFRLLCYKCTGLATKQSPLQQIDRILDRLRNIKYLSSEDSLNYPILLFSILSDVSQYMSNRMIDNALNSYFMLTLKFTIDNGSALRVVQLFTMWAHIQLQAEEVEKARIKLSLIDCFMRTAPAATPPKSRPEVVKAIIGAKHNTGFKIKESLVYNDLGTMETVRKVIPVSLSPIKSDKLSIPAISINLERYFFCPVKGSSSMLEWLYFETGCLNARLLYLVKKYDSLELFYIEAMDWCKQRLCDGSANCYYFRNIQMKLLIQYANFLRSTMKHSQALELIHKASAIYYDSQKHFDTVLRFNLWNQQHSSNKEIQCKSQINKSNHKIINHNREEKTSHPQLDEELSKAINKKLHIIDKKTPKTITSDDKCKSQVTDIIEHCAKESKKTLAEDDKNQKDLSTDVNLNEERSTALKTVVDKIQQSKVIPPRSRQVRRPKPKIPVIDLTATPLNYQRKQNPETELTVKDRLNNNIETINLITPIPTKNTNKIADVSTPTTIENFKSNPKAKVDETAHTTDARSKRTRANENQRNKNHKPVGDPLLNELKLANAEHKALMGKIEKVTIARTTRRIRRGAISTETQPPPLLSYSPSSDVEIIECPPAAVNNKELVLANAQHKALVDKLEKVTIGFTRQGITNGAISTDPTPPSFSPSSDLEIIECPPAEVIPIRRKIRACATRSQPVETANPIKSRARLGKT